MSVDDSTITEQASSRRTLDEHRDYAAAQSTVDYLSDKGFPVENVTIVGTELEYSEQVTGRTTIGREAVRGLGQGMLVGTLFAFFFGLFFDSPAFFGLWLYALIVGGMFGAIFAAAGHAATRGTRDFTSVAGTKPGRYEVQVNEPMAEAASRILSARAA